MMTIKDGLFPEEMLKNKAELVRLQRPKLYL